jgi:hypothetical protein
MVLAMKVFRAPPEFEDSSVPLRCRIQKADESGSPAVQSDFASIVLSVYDLANPRRKVVSDVTLSISSVIYNALQAWSVDSTGCNFIYVTLPAHMPQGERTYRFDVKFTFTNGAVRHAAWDVPSLDLKRT